MFTDPWKTMRSLLGMALLGMARVHETAAGTRRVMEAAGLTVDCLAVIEAI